MAEGEGTPKKKPRKTRRVGERASPATGGARSAEHPKNRGKARKASRPETKAGPQNGDAEWADIYDRAAKKLQDIADQARPAANRAQEAAKKMAVDLGGGVESAFGKIREQARDLMSKGQHTRVRIKFRGKQIAEVPIAVVAAAEMATFWWFGPLRVVLGHVVGKAVLDVEFVSNADHHVAEGRRLLADGELTKAIEEFDKALAMDRRCAGAHLGRGIALKLRGDKEGARAAFEKAEEIEPRGEAGREARRHLDNL
ncbi:MAG: tetratricopeptide repeat protein [Myxococcales bacterium]